MVDQAITNWVDKLSFIRLDPDEKLKLGEQDSIDLNSTLTSPKMIIERATKSYVDSLHEINRNRRDLSSIFNDQDNEFDNNKLTNLDSITVTREPILDDELSTKKYFEASIGEGTLLAVDQTLENYLKVTAGNHTNKLTNYDKIRITDTTEIKFPNIGSKLLQKRNIKCNNKNTDSKVGNFIKLTMKNSLTGYLGATSLPSIGDSFLYIETSSNNHGHEKVFVSFERTDIIHVSNITFYYNRFSILNIESKKSLRRFRIQLLLEDNSWSIRYNIPESDRYSDTSTQWTKLNLNFIVENYGILLFYDQINKPLADMCVSSNSFTHSV